jgi:pimeloyl-ACP methyl ester carboxylesterase
MMEGERNVLTHRGCRLAYAVRGGGFPVVFIQGVGVHGDGWLPQVDGLAHLAACLTFDNRGMGLSQPIGADASVEQMAEDAQALMDAMGWESAHVIGHSLGGLVALHLALTARGRVRSLALLCTFARGRDAGRSRRMLWLGLRTRLGTSRMRRSAFLEIVMPPGMLAGADRESLASGLAPTFGHDLAHQPTAVTKQLAALRAYDATARLGELSELPSLVVSAGHDPIAPPSLGRSLAAGVRGATYVEIPDASHGVPIHESERINALLVEHLTASEARWHARSTASPPVGQER